MKVTIRGASDDLIEVEGDIIEEFNPPYDSGDDPSYLAFGEGTVLSVTYDKNGMWRIHRVNEGSASFSKVEGDDPDKNYSDVVTLEGDLKLVTFGRSVAKPKKRTAK